MNRINWRECSYSLVNVIVCLSLFFGMLNLGMTPVVATPASTSPEIAEGDSIHLWQTAEEPLIFSLSLSKPVSSGVTWRVKIPAQYGEVFLSAQGDTTRVRYVPDRGVESVDYLVVSAIDGHGLSDEISVFIEPSHNLSREKMMRQTSIQMSRESSTQPVEKLQPVVESNDYAHFNPNQAIEPGGVSNTLVKDELDTELPVGEVSTVSHEVPVHDSTVSSPNWRSIVPEPIIVQPVPQPATSGPYMDVDYEMDKVWGYNWPAEVLVDLSINDIYYGTETSGTDGGVYFELTSDISPNDTLSMTDGTTTKAYFILTLVYQGNDQVNDLIYGTAVPFATVDVFACDLVTCASVTPSADENGNFTANFSTLVDIAPGSSGTIRLPDADGDATIIEWNIMMSEFIVNWVDDAVWGLHWPANSWVTVTRGSDTAMTYSDVDGNFNLYPNELGMDINPGDTVTVSAATTSKSHEVRYIEVTGKNVDANTITGATGSGAELTARACSEIDCEEVTVFADGAGNFTVPFTLVDIDLGTQGSVWISDNDYDRTEVFWRVPNPRFTVNINMQYVWGEDWTPGTTVTLNVAGTDVATAQVNGNGNPYFDTTLFGITPGQTVILTDGETLKTHLVQNLSVTEANEVEDTVSGTSDPYADVWVDSNNGMFGGGTTADEFGNWNVDFSAQTDLVKGSDGWARIFDEDNDWTEWFWRIPNPALEVEPIQEWIGGWSWPSFVDITMSINGTEFYGSTDINGRVDFFNYGIDVQAGDVVSMSDGVTTKSTVVTELALLGYDEAEDTVSGTAAPGSFVYSWACDRYGTCQMLYPELNEVGEFTADFTGNVDIGKNSYGDIKQLDEDNDVTIIYWNVPDPAFGVDPVNNTMWGWQWPANSTVTINVFDQTYYRSVNENGDWGTDRLPVDIVTGTPITVTEGTIVKTHTVLYAEVTSYDMDLEIVSGITESNVDLEAQVCDYGCEGLSTASDEYGNWSVDFSGVKDVRKGVTLYAVRRDDDGDRTQASLHIPDPSFGVDPRKNTIWGWDWPANSTVTIETPHGTIEWPVNENGDFGTDWLSQDIVVGDLIVITDGAVVKSHTVLDGVVTGFDLNLDAVNGTATGGAYVLIAACGYGDCQFLDTTADEFGNWAVDFSGIKDIRRGMELAAMSFDEDGDRTEATLYIPNPSFAVDPENNTVWAWEWPANSELTLTIGEFSISRTTNGNGDVSFDYVGFDLVAGNYLEVTDGAAAKSHTIQELSFIGFDPDLDTVSATATPESWVNVWACDYDNCNGMDFQADLEGHLIADMTLMGIDITGGTNGSIGRWDEDGDGTVINWKVLAPSFDVNPIYDEVWGWDWPANTSIELTVGTSIYYTSTNEYGDFGFYNEISEDISVGDILQVTDGIKVKTHTVMELGLTSFDEATDVVTGTAPAGAWVWSYACDYNNCDGMSVESDEFGVFTADMGSIGIDIRPGTNGHVRRNDEDNDGTCFGWRVPDPGFAVDPENDDAWGWQWMPNTEVVLVVDGQYFYTNTNENGDFGFGGIAYDLQVGDLVEITIGPRTKTHTILHSAFSDYGVDSDIVSGVTDPFTDISIRACGHGDCQEISTTGNESGQWLVDFSGFKDLLLGDDLAAMRWDEDGDVTEIHLHIPNPSFAVNPADNSAGGWEWPSDTGVELTINGTEIYNTVTDNNGNFGFDPFLVDVIAGDQVEVTVGTITKSLLVQNLELVYLDQDLEIVHGLADPDAWVNAWACDYDNCFGIDLQADAEGYFDADMGSGGIDVGPGADGNIGRWDEDGDGTVIHWHISNPAFDVNPENNMVWGWDWPASTEIEVSINGEFFYASSNENGDFYLDSITEDILVGDEVFVNDGMTFKYHLVLPISLTETNIDLDTISGTAESYREVNVWACNNYGCYGESTTAGEDGSFVVDLSGDWDLLKGQWGGIRVWDDDGDGTTIEYWIPDPSFAVNPVEDNVWGWSWPAFTGITLTAHGETFTGETNEWGDLDFGYLGIDLVAGDELSFSDGNITKTHTVYNLTYSGYDLDSDTISGTADSGAPVHVWACGSEYCSGIDPVVDEFGNWVADFSGQFDIVQGTDGGVQIVDEDNDDTRIYWRVPNPVIRVYPDDDMNLVAGWEWASNTDVDLYIDDVLEDTQTSDQNGFVAFSSISQNLEPGMVIQITDGFSTRTHTIIDLAFTEINEEDDTVSGVANPGDVNTYACDLTSCVTIWTFADEFRDWTVFYGEYLDIAPGSEGMARQFDAEGNSTRVYWNLALPYITASLDTDYIQAFDFKPGNTITIDIDDGTFTDSATSDEYGYAEFNPFGVFDVLPGQQIEISDGISTKILVVMDITVSELNADTDTITGTSAAGANLFVAAFDDNPPGTGLDITADGSGIWQVDFSGFEDIKIGTYGFVDQQDEDADVTSINFLLANEIPVISSLSPTFTTVGAQAMTLTVNGQHFSEGYSTVLWDSDPRPTTFISDTQLSIELSEYDLDEIHTAVVEVFTDEPGGGISDPAIEFPIIGYIPANGGKLSTSTVTLNWDDIPGANKYRIQLSTDINFGTTLVNTTTTYSTYTYTTPLSNGLIYYWRIQPRFGTIYSNWSPTLKFFSKNPPAAPILISPTTGTLTNSNNFSLVWSPAARGQYYQVQLAKDALFTLEVTSWTLPDGVTILSAPVGGWEDGTRYWRVRAYDEVGVKGKWSTVWNFKVDTKPPVQPVLYNPKDGAIKTKTPTFYWLAASGAKTYYLEYGIGSHFTTPEYVSAPLTTLYFKPPTMAEGTYYWRIRARDKAGNESTSLERKVIIDLP